MAKRLSVEDVMDELFADDDSGEDDLPDSEEGSSDNNSDSDHDIDMHDDVHRIATDDNMTVDGGSEAGEIVPPCFELYHTVVDYKAQYEIYLANN